MSNFRYSMDVGSGPYALNVTDIFQKRYGSPYNSILGFEVNYRQFVTKQEFDASFKEVVDEFQLVTAFTNYGSGYYNSKLPDGKREKDGIYLSNRVYTSGLFELAVFVTTATYGSLSITLAFNDKSLNDEALEQLKNSLFKFMDDNEKKEPKRSKINFICESKISGLYLKEVNLDTVINDDGEFDLLNHYNDNFKEAYDKIMSSLTGKKSKGIIMLYGFNGTGKTSFLRHLITSIDRKIIYISPDMSARLSDPSFLTFLMDHKNSVLIIEDAENVLKSREAGMNQAVSNLLNVTDGILGDGLRFQVICTFNTSYDQIDHALKRPGRLLAEYEFTRLDERKTLALVKKIYGEDAEPKEKVMSLGEIFNMNDASEFSNPSTRANKTSIGFITN